MAITVIPEAQPASDGLGGQEAQTHPADLRLSLNLAEFRSGLRHVVGSSLIGLTSAAATVGLFWTSWGTGQNEAAFFAGFTAVNTYWMIAYCRASCSTLFNMYRISATCAGQANRENAVLRKQNLRLVRERSRYAAGEADGDAGGKHPSPSASNLRFIPHKGRVQ